MSEITYRGVNLLIEQDVIQDAEAMHDIDIVEETKAAIDAEIAREYAAMNAEVYTKTLTHCPYCVKAKALLEKHGIPYREISVEENRDECFTRVREATGADPKTAPQIFIDGKHIGGHDELVKWIR